MIDFRVWLIMFFSVLFICLGLGACIYVAETVSKAWGGVAFSVFVAFTSASIASIKK